MAESTAFVFRMDVGGTQPAMCRSYQDIVRSKIFRSRLVYEMLRLCVIADCLNLLGCHILILKFNHWLAMRLDMDVANIDRKQYASQVFSTPNTDVDRQETFKYRNGT